MTDFMKAPDVLLMWRRFHLNRSSVPERTGDMGQLYGATLLPFGAICVVFLWESGASSIRTTLAVDTSRYVWYTWLENPKKAQSFVDQCLWRRVIHNILNYWCGGDLSLDAQIFQLVYNRDWIVSLNMDSLLMVYSAWNDECDTSHFRRFTSKLHALNTHIPVCWLGLR